MSTTRRPQLGIGRAVRALLVGAAALLLGIAAVGTTAFAEDPPVTDSSTTTEPTTLPESPPTVAADPVQTGDPVVQPAAVTTFTKQFSPNPILPGGTSTLTFTITADGTNSPVMALAFTDNLPTGVTVKTTPATPQCGGNVTATAPGTSPATITFGDTTGGTLAASSSCTIVVDVTAANPGSYLNTSGALDGSSGVSGSTQATDTLVVLNNWSKAFSPSQIAANGISTLTFTVDNTGNASAVSGLSFTDTLPTSPGAMVVAPTPNQSTTCTGGTLTATAGAGTISYSGFTVPANSSCTAQADVTAVTPGTYSNSVVLRRNSVNGPTATATMIVTPLFVSKVATPPAIPAGSTAAFQITVRNDSPTEALSNVTLSDALAPLCDRTFATLAVSESQTYTCTLANVTAAFTNTVVATATVPSGASVSAQATADVTVTAAPAPAALPFTGGPRTGLLAVIGTVVLLIGFLLVLGSSQRRRAAHG